MRSSHPSSISVRSDKIMTLIYGFVDASGSSFGSTLYCKVKVNYYIGTLSSCEDSNSSNWRELENIVFEVERGDKQGWLTGARHR